MGEKNGWIKLLFLFSLCTKSILVASQIEVEPLMSHGLFYRCLYYVSIPGNITVALLSMAGSQSSLISSKISYLAGDYFQVLRNIIASGAPMVWYQSSLIITPEWEYSSLPYRPRKSQLFIFRHCKMSGVFLLICVPKMNEGITGLEWHEG